MSKLTSKVAAIAAVGVIALVAAGAHAQTMSTTTTTTSTGSSMSVAQLQAQIASLQSQLAASQGTSMSAGASMSFTMNLTVGSTGSQVTALQQWLIAKGYSIPAGATGYFGAQTRSAVAAWQAASGISPAAGYFGPISRAKLNAAGGSTTTTTTTTTVAGCAAGAMYSSTTGQACGTSTATGPLSGGEGSINNLQVLGAPNNVTVYQGQTGQVYGFQFMSSGSDLNINRVDFDLTNTAASVGTGSTGGNDRPWAVLQTATLYDGSTVVGTVDATNPSNWSQDGYATVNGTTSTHQTYRIRFDNLHDVVKMGTTHQLFVSFTAQNGVSNANQTQYQIQLASQGVRAVDAEGIQQYSTSGNSNSTTFNVSNAAAGTVIISAASDNPQSSTVMANSTATTPNVVLGAFTIQAQNAPVTLYTLPVAITSTATSTGNLIEDVKLVENGTTVASQAVTSSTFTGGINTTLGGVNATQATTTLNNMNVTIPAGTTQEFQIVADINSVGNTQTQTGNSAEGSAASASIINSNLLGADLEQGSNRITPTGGFTGNTITFHVNGLSADATPTTNATVAANGGSNSTSQKGTFTFTFNVTAFGETVYLGTSTSAYTIHMHTTSGSGTTTPDSSVLTAVGTNGSTVNTSPVGNYVINPGQTAAVTVTGTLSNGAGSFYYATLDALKYSLSDTTTYSQSVNLTTNYRTQAVSINS